MRLSNVFLDKKGMTLVEVIVSLTILFLFMSCAIAIVLPTLTVYNRTITLADDQSIALNIADTIAHRISYSRYVSVSEDNKVLTVDGINISSPDGYLKIGESYSFDPGYYNGCRVNLNFITQDAAIEIKVEIIRGTEKVFAYQITTKPLYIGLH